MKKGSSLNRCFHICILGPRRGFQELYGLYDGLAVLYAAFGRQFVGATDDPTLSMSAASPTRALSDAPAAMAMQTWSAQGRSLTPASSRPMPQS